MMTLPGPIVFPVVSLQDALERARSMGETRPAVPKPHPFGSFFEFGGAA